MTKKINKQLELPILTDVNIKSGSIRTPSIDRMISSSNVSDFHRIASKEDESIYKLISDSYFKSNHK